MLNIYFTHLSRIHQFEMTIETDKQYGLTLEEADKIARRLAIKRRLQDECFRIKWDPYLQMKRNKFLDPASVRYQDFRKKGRLPGAPYSAGFFWSLTAATLSLPVFLFVSTWWLRYDYERMARSGEIKPEEFNRKSMR